MSRIRHLTERVRRVVHRGLLPLQEVVDLGLKAPAVPLPAPSTDRVLRIGILRIAQESNALSPRLSEVEDFFHDLDGDALLAAVAHDGVECEGFLRHAELSGFCRAVARLGDRAEVVPLFSAWAVPGGPLSLAALDHFRGRLAGALREAGPLDAVMVSLHGAMVGEADSRPETVLLQDLRAALGPDIPIVATLDLHGHLTPDFVAPLTFLCAYRTNPHRDHARVGERCGEMLVDMLLGRFKPTMAWRSLPMMLGGGTTLDFLPPMRALFRKMSAMEQDPSVRYVSLFMCHIWLSSPDVGWATVVVTDDDQAKAERLAEELADAAWGVRHHLPPELPDAEQALARARRARLRRRLGTICISDASDMVGAGAPGDNTRLLRVLLEQGQGLRIYSTLLDPGGVAALWPTPVGGTIARDLGGHYAGSSPPVPVRATVRHKVEGPFGRTLVLDADHVQLVLTERPPLAMQPAFYRSVGLRPSRADIVVVKSLFPFRLYFLLHNRLTLYARTEGATDFDVAFRQDYDGPVHPKDAVDDWREGDRRRRLGA